MSEYLVRRYHRPYRTRPMPGRTHYQFPTRAELDMLRASPSPIDSETYERQHPWEERFRFAGEGGEYIRHPLGPDHVSHPGQGHWEFHPDPDHAPDA